MGDNEAERAWTEKAGETWVRQRDRTDAQLGPLGLAVIEELAPKAGERVLDVGCGTGQTLLQLAERVGSAGHVVGLDVSEPMITEAKARIAKAGASNVELVLGNAAAEIPGGPFDIVFSRFGVMFFDDSVAAFSNLRSAMKTAGRLGFVCWQPLEKNPWVALPLNAVRKILPDQPLPALLAPDKPGPFYFSSPEFVRDVLASAGFEQIAIEPREFHVSLGGAKTLDEAVDYCLDLGPTARFVGDAPKERVPELRTAVRDSLAPLVTEDGVFTDFLAYVVTARAPGP
jgi:SAM-dependent methyltransferase